MSAPFPIRDLIQRGNLRPVGHWRATFHGPVLGGNGHLGPTVVATVPDVPSVAPAARFGKMASPEAIAAVKPERAREGARGGGVMSGWTGLDIEEGRARIDCDLAESAKLRAEPEEFVAEQ